MAAGLGRKHCQAGCFFSETIKYSSRIGWDSQETSHIRECNLPNLTDRRWLWTTGLWALLKNSRICQVINAWFRWKIVYQKQLSTIMQLKVLDESTHHTDDQKKEIYLLVTTVENFATGTISTWAWMTPKRFRCISIQGITRYQIFQPVG